MPETTTPLSPTHRTGPGGAPLVDVALSEGPALPFNLQSGFRGVDATQPIFSERGLRAGLFDLAGRSTKRVGAPTAANPAQAFDVPGFLDFVWSSDNKSVTVAGETKASFQRTLTNQVTSGISAGGFGLEFKETFSEDHFEETFHKYAAHYERQQVYFVRLKGAAARYLSDEAAEDFEALTPAQIVDKYGTHYMATAVFGGLKVFSTRVDIRDEIDKTKIETAMQMSVKVTDPESGQSASGNAGTSNADEQTRKLHQKMSVQRGRVIGGEDGANWRTSLNVNPALIGYDLKPLSDLAGADKQAALKAEIDRRLAAQQVATNATLLAMMVEVQAYTSDRGSGADRDLTVGRPRYVPGWFYLGQYGLPQGGSFPGGARALVVRNLPGSDNSAVRQATGFNRHWGKSSSYGLYSAAAPGGYTSIGDLYESTDNPGAVGWLNFYGCLRNDLVENSNWTGLVWADWGSGARDDGSAWGFENNDPKAIQLSGNWSTAPRMFKVAGNYDQPGAVPKRPKMSVMKMLSDSWL